MDEVNAAMQSPVQDIPQSMIYCPVSTGGGEEGGKGREEISSLSRTDMVMVMVDAAMQSPVHSYFNMRYCLLSIGRRGVGGEL